MAGLEPQAARASRTAAQPDRQRPPVPLASSSASTSESAGPPAEVCHDPHVADDRRSRPQPPCTGGGRRGTDGPGRRRLVGAFAAGRFETGQFGCPRRASQCRQRAATGGRQRAASSHESTIGRTDDVRVEEPGSLFRASCKLAAGAWDEVTLLVAPESKNTAPPERSRQTEAKEGWIDGLQHQLKPMGRGLDNAFDFLWQAGQSGDG